MILTEGSHTRRRRFRRRIARLYQALPLLLAIIGLIIAALVILLGCAPPPSPPDPSALRLRLAEYPLSLDPALAVDDASLALIAQLHDGLVVLDPVTGEPGPAIARSWDIDSGGRIYTFHLDERARFHDGRAVAAQDVVFSYERLLSPGTDSPHGWLLKAVRGSRAYREGRAPRVAGLRAADPATVVIELEEPYSPFLSLLALEPAGIIPGGASSDPNFAARPIGAGPFEVVSREPGREIVLGASPFYRESLPGIHKILYSVIPSASVALEAYTRGDLDVLDELPAGSIQDLSADVRKDLRRHPQAAVAFLAFNHVRGPFHGNRALRQAFNHAIDREGLCASASEGRDLPAGAILPPGIEGHDPRAGRYSYDPDRARRLLAAAGYPGGRGLPEITLACTRSRVHRSVCRKIREDLRAVGVKIALRETDASDLMAQVQSAETSGSDVVLFRMAWLADYPHPEAFLRPTLHSGSSSSAGNYGRYANRALDRVLDRALREPDPVESRKLYQRAERMAVDDAAWVFLYHYGDEALVKPWVGDLIFPTYGELQGPLEAVTIDRTSRLAHFLGGAAGRPAR